MSVKTATSVKEPDWLRLYQNSLEDIAKDAEFTKEIFRVWIYLISQVHYENHIRTRQVDVARELGIDGSRVCKVYNILVKKGIIEKTGKGHSATYQLSSNFGYKGKICSDGVDSMMT